MRIRVAVAVACLSAMGISTAHDAQAAIKKETTIPAQGLGPALKQLADERDIQLVYRSEVVGARQTSGAVGELTFDEALTKLLKGTGLTYQYIDDRAITIVPMDSTSSSSSQASGHRPQASSEAGVWGRFRLAQAEQGSSRPNDSSKDIPRRTTLEEVIVTAQKREERLQDVPISITAITGDEITQRGLIGAADYLRGIPGVNQQEQGYGGQAVVIRGLETSLGFQNWVAGGPLVATYFGETPMTNSGGLLGSNADVKLIDIERVEVLRGPQGTAFGNASMTGVVRTIPVAPKLNSFEAKLTAGFSSTSDSGDDNNNVQAMINIPLIDDRLAIRAAGYRYEESGIYRNRAGSNAAFQASLVNPFTGAPYFPGGAYSLGSFAVDRDDIGSSSVLGGRIAALLQVSDDLRFTFSYLAQKDEIDGQPLANSGRREQISLDVAPQHVIRGRKEGVNDSNVDVANALMEYNLGWADLLATYSHIESDSDHAVPLTPGIPWPVSFLSSDPHRENSSEIRISTKFNGAWNFLVGLFAEEQDDEFESHWIWFADPATNFFGDSAVLDHLDRRTQKQKSAFADVSWQFLPSVTLTVGARAYDYERTGNLNESGGLLGGGTNSQISDADSTGTNYRANLTFKPSDDSLVYATWAEGFRLGRPQARAATIGCDSDRDGIVDGTNISVESTGHIDSDSVDNYELGGKIALLDRRLNLDAAVFRMEWKDFPVSAPKPITCNGFLVNVGAARSEGIELQANFQITDKLRADFGGSYVDARVTENSPTGDLRADDRLPGSPKVTANFGLQHQFVIAGHSAFVRADSIYVGSFYGIAGEKRISPNNRPGGDYMKLDVTAGMAMRHLDLQLYVRNLTNEYAFVARNPYSFNDFGDTVLRPRTVGVQIEYSFGR